MKQNKCFRASFTFETSNEQALVDSEPTLYRQSHLHLFAWCEASAPLVLTTRTTRAKAPHDSYWKCKVRGRLYLQATGLPLCIAGFQPLNN